MSVKNLVVVKVGILLILTGLFLGACNRGSSSGVRFASTSDSGINNAPINNGPPGVTAVPVVSYADIVSRVSPAVITIHSEMRVRDPQQFRLWTTHVRQFFGDRVLSNARTPQRSRFGVIIVLRYSNKHHVIDGAEQSKWI